MGETKVNLKLLIDTKANKVFFAEGSKDFVDFLLHILSLPIATAIKLLTTNGMVGCLGDLYRSIEVLNGDYLQPDVEKDKLLKPNAAVSVPLLLVNDAPDYTLKKFYRCSNTSYYHFKNIADDCRAICPECGCKMSVEVNFVAPPKGSNSADVATMSAEKSATASGEGFVKGVVTYMVMDNLEVKPMSTISGITLINKFQVKDVGCLTEKEVQVGLNEALAMLKASLECRAVLTAVFLGKKV